MASKRKPNKTYPKEFKLEALRLMEESEQPASEIAKGKKGQGKRVRSCSVPSLILHSPSWPDHSA